MTTTIEPPVEKTVMTLDNAMRLASQLQTQGKLAQAEKVLNNILAVYPNHAHALHLLGVVAHQAGNTPLAIQFIQRAINSDATISLFHTNIGEMHRQLKATDLSIECGLRAIALDPNSAVALSNLGIAYYDTKNYDQAEICHQRALALNPQQSNSLNNMGSINKERKNAEEAMRYYRAAMASSPGYVEPINNLGAVLVTEQKFDQAIEVLNRALILSPDLSDAHCNLGFAFHGLERDDKALMHFQRALELKPNYPEAYIGLGKIYKNKVELEEAESYVLKAIELEPDKADFYQCLAEIYSEQGNTEQALASFDRALIIEPDSGSARVSKGNLLVELGEKDEAEALISSAINDPSHMTQFSAHCSLIQLRSVKANDQSMQALLSTLDNIHTLAPKQQQFLHFSLGKCYDDLGESSSAFKHFNQGCQLKRSHISYSSEEQTKFAQRIVNSFTKEKIESLRLSANPSTLPIFVLGMPRSGTTLVEQVIASHPSVYGAGELNYLSRISHRLVESDAGMQCYPESLDYLTAEKLRAMADEYLTSLQSHEPSFSRITDKMPGNYTVIGLIHTLLPQAKIIHIERNPIDTCLSCYTKLFRHGQAFSYDLVELGHFYANYRRIMAHWRSVLPANSWYDVQYENFVGDLESEAKKLIAYCGLDWDPACLDFHTAKRQVRTASLTQVRKPIYTSSVERWKRYESDLAPLINALKEGGCL